MRNLAILLDAEPGLAMRFYCKLAQKLAEILLSTNPSDKKPNKIEKPKSTTKFETLHSSDKILETKFGLKDEVVVKGRKDIG